MEVPRSAARELRHLVFERGSRLGLGSLYTRDSACELRDLAMLIGLYLLGRFQLSQDTPTAVRLGAARFPHVNKYGNPIPIWPSQNRWNPEISVEDMSQQVPRLLRIENG